MRPAAADIFTKAPDISPLGFYKDEGSRKSIQGLDVGIWGNGPVVKQKL